MSPGPGSAAERRRHDRYTVGEPAILRIIGVKGGVYLITVIDVSKSGLRLSCSVSLAPGTRVEVRWRGARIEGEVRYAREVQAHEFHLGMAADVGEDQDLTLLYRPRG